MLRAPQGNDGRVLRDVGEIAFPQRDIVNAVGFRLERGMGFLEHALGTRVAGVLPHAAKRQPDQVLVGAGEAVGRSAIGIPG